MILRIKKYNKGWVVEIQKIKWYGKKHWIHFISASGLSYIAWYHSTYKHAESNMLNKIKWSCIEESKIYKEEYN